MACPVPLLALVRANRCPVLNSSTFLRKVAFDVPLRNGIYALHTRAQRPGHTLYRYGFAGPMSMPPCAATTLRSGINPASSGSRSPILSALTMAEIQFVFLRSNMACMLGLGLI